jgi:cytochrome c oxidase subunit II
MLAGSAFLFLLCMTLFGLAVSRHSWARRILPRHWLVLGGLVLPTIVLGPLLVFALISGERLLPSFPAGRLQIEADARQWSWTFRYPDNGGAQTIGILHLPAGIPVKIIVTSEDVIHAFWIPRLAGKIDAVPGHANVLRIEADHPGRYQGLCNEFCGTGHTGMRFDVVVHPAAEFTAALASPNAEGKVPQ